MKITKISDTKIKIELCEKEITSWSNIKNTKVPDYNAMMVDLIRAAEKVTGISFRDCQVIVEATADNNNTYSVFVTKGAARTPLKKQRKSASTNYPPKNFIVAEFADMDNLESFNKNYPLYSTLLDGVNSLYSYNGYYYLVINIPKRFSSYENSLRGHLSEFSADTSETAIPYFIEEKGDCLLKDRALMTLKNI